MRDYAKVISRLERELQSFRDDAKWNLEEAENFEAQAKGRRADAAKSLNIAEELEASIRVLNDEAAKYNATAA